MRRAAALVLFCGQVISSGGVPLQRGSSMNQEFSAYAVENPQSVTSVRLLSLRAAPVLVRAHERELRQVLSADALDGDAPTSLSWNLPRSFTPGEWDVATTGNGAVATISTDPGSANCLLWFAVSNRPDERRHPHQRRSGVYTAPRFVKGYAGPGHLMSAIRDDDHPTRVVFFRDPSDESPVVDPADVFSTEAVLDEAVAVRFGSGYLLFYKVWGTDDPEEDEDKPIPSRAIRAANGPLRSGPLAVVRLGGDFKPQGAPATLPGSDVFQFDADATGNRLTLLATTERGMRLGIATPRPGSNELVWAWTETESPAALESPSVLASGEGFYLALMESPAGGAPRVLVRSVREH